MTVAYEHEECRDIAIMLSSEMLTEIAEIHEEKESQLNQIISKSKEGKGEDEKIILDALYQNLLEPVYSFQKRLEQIFIQIGNPPENLSKAEYTDCKVASFPKQELLDKYLEIWDTALTAVDRK